MGGGIAMIVAGILTAGGITVWAFWAAGKIGPGVWTSAKSLPLLIAFWLGGAALIAGGIYFIAADHPHGGRHGRARIEIHSRAT